MNDWLTVFTENYNGRSKEAQELQTKTKPSARAGVYIPWAIIERMARTQDPDLYIEPVLTENGNIVHTDKFTVINTVANKTTGGYDQVESMVVSHVVFIEARFLGKKLIEYYPIQDTGTYAAVKVYDQNLVNKSIQRAKAKALSRLTGLGLMLYEKGDLQFVEDGEKIDDAKEEPKKPEPAKVTRRQNANNAPRQTPTEEPKPMDEPNPAPTIDHEPEPAVDESVEINADALTLAKLLLGQADPTVAQRFVRIYNNSFQKSYGFVVTLDETEIELAQKLSLLPDPSKILSAATTKGLK